MIRMGFHYHIPAERRGGRIYTASAQGRFIDSLAACCESMCVFLYQPRPSETELMDYEIRSKNVTLIPVGVHDSVPVRLVNRGRVIREIKMHIPEIDCLLLRGPSPLLPSIGKHFKDRIPVSLLLVGDYVEALKISPVTLKGAFVSMWARWNKRNQAKTAASSLVFVNSRRLYEELSGVAARLQEINTTTLTEKDFFKREDTCRGLPVRLLYAGRISLEKGLREMIHALSILTEAGKDFIWDFVGMEEGKGVWESLRNLASDKGVEDRIHYHGFRSMEQDLFSFYRKADIFVMASLSSFEGFPRALWEAMSHSLPIVATRVGSIGNYAQDIAVLVEPGKVADLASAIDQVSRNPGLRRQMISRGWEKAQDKTLEIQAVKMVKQIEKWVGEKRE